MHLICFSHITRTAGFLPPADVWKAGKDVLPYGWERAVDDTGRSYFIKYFFFEYFMFFYYLVAFKSVSYFISMYILVM